MCTTHSRRTLTCGCGQGNALLIIAAKRRFPVLLYYQWRVTGFSSRQGVETDGMDSSATPRSVEASLAMPEYLASATDIIDSTAVVYSLQERARFLRRTRFNDWLCERTKRWKAFKRLTFWVWAWFLSRLLSCHSQWRGLFPQTLIR